MKSRSIRVLTALIVALAVAGVSYWQININKDWREQYAYTKGVDALIYAFPYYLNTVLRYKWSQPEAPEGQQVPLDAVNKFWHATFVDPKNYKSYAELSKKLYEVLGETPVVTTTEAVSLDEVKEAPVVAPTAESVSEPTADDDDAMSFFAKLAKED